MLALPIAAQVAALSAPPGAQSLDDILARQDALGDGAGDATAVRERRPGSAAGDGIVITPDGSMGPLNDWSDPGVWRAVRQGGPEATSQIRGPAATTLIQTGGMEGLTTRSVPLRFWDGPLLVGTLASLTIFFVFRGRIRIDGPKTGRMLLRFRTCERFARWLLSGSSVALAITGLLVLFGRMTSIPLFGPQAWGPVAIVCNWVHNNISWAFMLALMVVFVTWVVQNIPDRTD